MPADEVSPGRVDEVDTGRSAFVVNALVVLDGAPRPFNMGLAAVTLFDVGVASLCTAEVLFLEIAGLAHGSSCGSSSESFRIRRDFAAEEAACSTDDLPMLLVGGVVSSSD